MHNLTMNPRMNLSDSGTELWNQARSYFKNTLITSYTKIHLNGPMISITIEKREHTEGKTPVTLP